MRSRKWWNAAVVAAACMMTSGAPAQADTWATARTDDGYGVLVGSSDAPVQLEIFCEPQCPVCKRFEAEAGDRIVGELAAHRLAVTYRWLTFLDDRRHNDTSARVSRALMLAADPTTVPVAYQNFVAAIYRHQDADAPAPSDDALATMARESGIPGPMVDRIALGTTDSDGTDAAAMNAANRERLVQQNPEHPGTPTVYDLTTHTVVDIDDPGWLDRLLQAG